jgi:hypothetical protein
MLKTRDLGVGEMVHLATDLSKNMLLERGRRWDDEMERRHRTGSGHWMG